MTQEMITVEEPACWFQSKCGERMQECILERSEEMRRKAEKLAISVIISERS